jgi:FtsH-binding integral membrane protein
LPLIFLRKGHLLVDWKKILQYAGIGLIIVTHWILFYGSIKVSNVSIALSCLASASLFSAIIEPLIMKKSFNIVEIALGVLVIFGIYLIFTFHNFYLKGILMGIGSAFFAALFSVLNKKIINNSDTYVASFWELLSGFVFLGLIGLIVVSLVNIFLQSPAISFATSFVGVAIFMGLTAWDTQKLKSLYYQSGGGEMGEKTAIMGAFTLYLDFINLFLYMLRFFGDRK